MRCGGGVPDGGQGVCKYPSGDVYAGDWRGGRRDGEGALIGSIDSRNGAAPSNAAAAAAAASNGSSAAARSAVEAGGVSFEGEFRDGRIATAHGAEGVLRFE